MGCRRGHALFSFPRWWLRWMGQHCSEASSESGSVSGKLGADVGRGAEEAGLGHTSREHSACEMTQHPGLDPDEGAGCCHSWPRTQGHLWGSKQLQPRETGTQGVTVRTPRPGSIRLVGGPAPGKHCRLP